MKKISIKISAISFAITIVFLSFNACNIAQQKDLNAPSVNTIETSASISELNNLVSGTLSGMRGDYDFYSDDCAMIGRDYYRFSSADPRFASDLPGTCNAFLDNNTFYIVRPWGSFYQVIRNAWILRHAVTNYSSLSDPLTTEQKNGYTGFAKTITALEMLWLSNLTYDNPKGCIRTDVENPDNLGSFVSHEEALTFISSLLDEAYNDLQNSGTDFLFALSSGFPNFTDPTSLATPADFMKFNRALKARVDIYQQNWQGALDDLNNSFFSLTGDLHLGCSIAYSTGSGDVANNLFISIPNQPTNARVAVNSWVGDAEPGDLRLSKVVARATPATTAPSVCSSGDTSILTSSYDVALWSSQDDNVSIIRNEELILIYAEANIQLNNLAEGENALNTIRTAAGLPAYGGTVDQASLVDEMLKQRRYSLFAEGDRWIDMRRYNRLNQIQTDNPDEDVWEFFPIPASEPQ